MGSGSGAIKSQNNLHWTDEENVENEAALRFQMSAADLCAEYFYYGLPVKMTKESIDPLSPSWVQVDQNLLSEFQQGTSSIADDGAAEVIC